MSGRTTDRLGATVAALALGAAAVLGGCGTDEADDATTTTVAATTTGDTPTTGAPTSTTAVADGSTTTAPADPGPGDDADQGFGALDEGSHVGYLTGVDDGTVDGQAVQVVAFDPIEMLTGDEAVAAAIEHGDLPPDATAIDNDYYLVNDDATPVRLPVIPDGQVWVLVEGTPDTVPGSVDEAVARPGLYRIEVVVVRGVSLITGIEGVFVP